MENIKVEKIKDSGLVMKHPFQIWFESYILSMKHTFGNFDSFIKDLLPVLEWLPKYNTKWFIGDLIAGITVGIMVIPQSLSYALLAGLPPQYGLYTAMVGPVLYFLLGTSKDISIGPTAVISLLTGQAVNSLSGSGYSPATIAITLSFLSGVINVAMRIINLSIIIEFISIPVIIGFTSGSAVSIIASQFPTLIGIKGINTNGSTLKTVIETFKNIKTVKYLDAIFGVTTVMFILLLKFSSERLKKINPKFYFLGVLKNALAIILFTLISFSIGRNSEKLPINIVGTVKGGFPKPKAPELSSDLFTKLIGKAVTITLVVVLEHVSIAKALARVDHYEINSNSEILSQGITNIVGSFFGSYASTGSFSRSSVNRASGSQSPFNGLWTTLVVVISILFLSKGFFYIPKATMAAIISISVYELISTPKSFYNLWRIGPTDFLGLATSFFATVFVSIEVGIYSAIGVSIFSLLVKTALPKITVLSSNKDSKVYVDVSIFSIPLPNTGVVVVRPEDSLIFINSSHVKNNITEIVNALTVVPVEEKNKNKGSGNVSFSSSNSSRVKAARNSYLDHIYQSRMQYNISRGSIEDARAELEKEKNLDNTELPALRALILDMSVVSHMDATGIQMLLDLQAELKDLSKKQYEYLQSINSTASANSSDTKLKRNETLIDITKLSKNLPLNPENFKIHYVNVKPNVLRVMEISGITNSIISYRDRISQANSIFSQSIEAPESSNNSSGNSSGPNTFDHINLANRMLFDCSDNSSPVNQNHNYEFVTDNIHKSIDSAIVAINIDMA
ncbi:hypothetical protein BB558_007037 [Smittium angustum]|uniref:STAS domain-containing protein n=1 Tax=Smittium angustum TaxID=133377 RepID=A0A2U1IWC1_SMIAN|nr:hypothetical protein BB558_007037 [Smittium angustum]